MARSTMYVLLFGMLVLGYLGWRANPGRQPAREELTEADVEIGRFIFDRECDSCHGPAAPASRLSVFVGNQATFNDALNEEHDLASFDIEFNDVERQALWAYVEVLRAE